MRTPVPKLSKNTLLRKLRLIPSEPGEESFPRAFMANIGAILFWSIVVLLLEYKGYLRGMENQTLDSELRTQYARTSDAIYLVQITDDDYKAIFHGKSPLDPNALKNILTAIEAAHPALIGVDLDTSDAQFGRNDWPTAVWGRGAEPICERNGDADVEETGCEDADRYVRLAVLGGIATETEAEPGVIETQPKSGIAGFPSDPDGVVRHYRANFHSDTAEPASPLKGLVDSFPRTLAKEYARIKRKPIHKRAEGEPVILNFTANPYTFPRMSAKQLLEGAARPYWTNKSPLRDRIVVLGGVYRSGRDTYFTPVGRRSGLAITAQAVETELTGGGIHPVNLAYAWAIDVLAGICLVALDWRIRSRFSGLIKLTFLAVVALGGSFLAFRAFAHWFNFTAVLFCVWLHTLSEDTKAARKRVRQLQAELDSATLKLKNTRIAEETAMGSTGSSS
jgi:CHASE2 domain-containing sensor protein